MVKNPVRIVFVSIREWWQAVQKARDLLALQIEISDIRDRAIAVRNDAARMHQEAIRLAEQESITREHYEEIIADLQVIALQSQRGSLILAIAAREALDQPEYDIREGLDRLIEDLSNAVAVLEEQVVL